MRFSEVQPDSPAQHAPDALEFLGGRGAVDAAVGHAALDEFAGGAVSGDLFGAVGGGAVEDAVRPAGQTRLPRSVTIPRSFSTARLPISA